MFTCLSVSMDFTQVDSMSNLQGECCPKVVIGFVVFKIELPTPEGPNGVPPALRGKARPPFRRRGSLTDSPDLGIPDAVCGGASARSPGREPLTTGPPALEKCIFQMPKGEPGVSPSPSLVLSLRASRGEPRVRVLPARHPRGARGASPPPRPASLRFSSLRCCVALRHCVRGNNRVIAIVAGTSTATPDKREPPASPRRRLTPPVVRRGSEGGREEAREGRRWSAVCGWRRGPLLGAERPGLGPDAGL